MRAALDTMTTDAMMTAKNPFLTADGLTLYFASDRTGGMGGNDFWRATRESPEDPFGTATPVRSLNSGVDDGRVELTPDGLAGVFSSLRSPNVGNYDLWLATRSDLTAEFTLEALPKPINSEQADKNPHFSGDGARLYFSVDSKQLLVARRSGRTFDTPTPLPGLENLPNIGDPNLSPDELSIVFSSQLQSSIDLYVATRASTTDRFGVPIALDQVNRDDHNDQDAFVTRDGCALWFASTRDTGFHIYVATIAQ